VPLSAVRDPLLASGIGTTGHEGDNEDPMEKDYYSRVEEAASALRPRIGDTPQVGVVLGSGLGDFADRLTASATIPYGDIPHWPASAVVGHAGKLVVGTLAGKRVAALAGRAHFYEGHTLQTATFATRVLGLLGVKTLILTNAAGGINVAFKPGTLMIIDDHINLMGSNPLVGPNDDRFGARFPDMTEVYSRRLRRIADSAAASAGVAVTHGVYVALHGPSYETPAEIRYLRAIGADAVGMSTVPEAIVGRHMGMEILGISCITNPAAGVLPQPLVHDEVMEVARRVRAEFSSLLEGIIERI
jgi:purine-nucleoside phosphorylase